MIETEFYSRAVHGAYETFNIGDLVLEDRGYAAPKRRLSEDWEVASSPMLRSAN
jgi:hypothetical protein